MASFQAQTEPHSHLTLWACILLPCPAGILLFIATVQVSHPRLLLSGWLLTNVQVNIITMLHDTSAHVFTSHLYCYSFLLSIHLLFSWAGWLPSTRSIRYNSSSTYTATMGHQIVFQPHPSMTSFICPHVITFSEFLLPYNLYYHLRMLKGFDQGFRCGHQILVVPLLALFLLFLLNLTLYRTYITQ